MEAGDTLTRLVYSLYLSDLMKQAYFLGMLPWFETGRKWVILTNQGDTSGGLSMEAMFKGTRRIMDDFQKIFYKIAFWPAPFFILLFPGV
jgi:hypothetical protein